MAANTRSRSVGKARFFDFAVVDVAGTGAIAVAVVFAVVAEGREAPVDLFAAATGEGVFVSTTGGSGCGQPAAQITSAKSGASFIGATLEGPANAAFRNQ
jgi:hypothetical protein